MNRIGRNAGMSATKGRKAEIIVAVIAGTTYRKRVFKGQRFLAVCQSSEDYERGLPVLVTAWRTADEAQRTDEENRRSGCEFHAWSAATPVSTPNDFAA